jgi:hypothetical protein
MTWWQWILVFFAICLWPLSVLVAVVIGAKLAKGEPIEIRKLPLPKPTYLDPGQANKIIADRKREQDERSANFKR